MPWKELSPSSSSSSCSLFAFSYCDNAYSVFSFWMKNNDLKIFRYRRFYNRKVLVKIKRRIGGKIFIHGSHLVSNSRIDFLSTLSDAFPVFVSSFSTIWPRFSIQNCAHISLPWPSKTARIIQNLRSGLWRTTPPNGWMGRHGSRKTCTERMPVCEHPVCDSLHVKFSRIIE